MMSINNFYAAQENLIPAAQQRWMIFNPERARA
jgi:hypothetical protein